MSTVLVTGSAGRIGTELTARLPELGWDVRGFDREDGDVTVPADLDRVVQGVDAIVHLAGIPTEVAWKHLLPANIDGSFQVFDAARRAGVPRIVYASSNHAAGFWPADAPLPADVAPRPDTLYGVSKAFGEALARYYVDRYGLQIACLRIGTFAPEPTDRRSLATWLSPADCARLVDACLRSAELDFALVWGISNNTRRTWDLAAGHALGYFPADDAEAFADRLPEAAPDPSDAYLGGGFTSPGFGVDERKDETWP
jgi:uronate dehydrogenase